MKTHVLKGSKQEIAESLIRMSGEVREAIVFEEESPEVPEAATQDAQKLFAEMDPFMVDASDVDDSRQAVYTRIEGE